MNEHRHESHTANRLEAFSDGIFAVIITITVIEMREPLGTSLHSLIAVIPVMLSYLFSFVSLIIYWNNHHHLLRHVHKVTPGVMWANAHLLFWLSLIPFATIWLGESGVAIWPTVIYSTLLLFAGLAYYILQTLIVRAHRVDSELVRAIGKNIKGKISPVLYILAILGAFISPWISYVLILIVALIWIIPDRRFEALE